MRLMLSLTRFGKVLSNMEVSGIEAAQSGECASDEVCVGETVPLQKYRESLPGGKDV
jgi:hypothetical protein